MTAVHEAREGGSLRHTPNQFSKDCIVSDLTSRLVVDRNQGFIVSILLVVVVVGKTTSVTRVVKEGTVSTFGRCSEFLEGGNDIGVRRGSMGTIILLEIKQYMSSRL
jgi:hypothetical protein